MMSPQPISLPAPRAPNVPLSHPPNPMNAALGTLSAEALALLEPHLRQRFFEEGSVLWDCGERIARFYFPISAIVSVVLPVGDGNGAEVGNVGREGGVGIAYGPKQEHSPTRGLVHPGVAVRERCRAERRDRDLGGVLSRLAADAGTANRRVQCGAHRRAAV